MFQRRVAIQHRLAILRHPSGQAFSQWNSQRCKQTEVVSVHIFRKQFISPNNVGCNRVIGHKALQPSAEHRKSLAQAQRVAQVLGKLKERLRFVARCGNRRKESSLVPGVIGFVDGKSIRWSFTALDFNVS